MNGICLCCYFLVSLLVFRLVCILINWLYCFCWEMEMEILQLKRKLLILQGFLLSNIDYFKLLEYVIDVVKYVIKGILRNLELKIVGNN